MRDTPFGIGMVVGTLLLLAVPAGAQDRHHRPPQEAVTACANLSANTACSFSMGDQSVTGTCELPPGGSALACRPSGPPPEHNGHGPAQHGPPQQAINACSGLSANATCAFAHGSTNITGRCVPPPGDSTGSLACRPDRAPPLEP